MRAALLCLFVLVCVPAAAQDPVLPTAPDAEAVTAEMKKLDFMVGTWEGDEKWWVGPGEPTIVKGKIIATVEGSGRFLVSRYDEKGTPLGDMSGVSITTYDPEEKEYKLWEFNAYANAVAATGSFEDDVFVVTMDTESMGQKMKLKFFYKKLSDTEYELKIDVSFDDGTTWLKSVEAVFKKIS